MRPYSQFENAIVDGWLFALSVSLDKSAKPSECQTEMPSAICSHRDVGIPAPATRIRRIVAPATAKALRPALPANSLIPDEATRTEYLQTVADPFERQRGLDMPICTLMMQAHQLSG